MLARKRKKPGTPAKLPEKNRPKRVNLAELFRTVWETRPHKCETCGKVLREPRAHNFAHIEHRGMGGCESRNTAENVMLLCYACHTEYDTGKRPNNAEWMDT